MLKKVSIATLLALIGLGWGVFAWITPPPEDKVIMIAVFDACRTPVLSVDLLGPDGTGFEVSRHGIARLPYLLHGNRISVRDRATSKELASFISMYSEGQAQEVIVGNTCEGE